MQKRFEFGTAAQIIFGPGTLRDAALAAMRMGDRALIVSGLPLEQSAGLAEDLHAMDVMCSPFKVDGEPTLDLVRQGTKYALQEHCNLVIGFGARQRYRCRKGHCRAARQ